MTSGFNIAEIFTLEESLINMLGFTHKETSDYLSHVFDSFSFEYVHMPEILEIMKTNYDGYHFLPDTEESLYNSTIVIYFYKTYLGQFPAPALDKINENFIRCTFYELCTRYLSRYFTFSMEVNYPSGRSDWEMTGKYHTKHKNTRTIIEFKYAPSKEANHILSLEAPLEADANQVLGYKNDALQKFTHFTIEACVIYVAGNKGFRYFKAD